MASDTDRERMEQAVTKIQRTIYRLKVKRKREGREIREQLQKLPYICRNGFMKMLLLKANTNSLQREVKYTFKF